MFGWLTSRVIAAQRLAGAGLAAVLLDDEQHVVVLGDRAELP